MINKEFWNGKTVLITGSNGFVGKNLLSYISCLDCLFLIPTRKELDLTCQKQTSDFFSSNNIDIVIHLAGLVGGIEANNSRLGDFFYQNAMIGINVFHYSYLNGVQKFVDSCQKYGVDGLIIVDLQPEEDSELSLAIQPG